MQPRIRCAVFVLVLAGATTSAFAADPPPFSGRKSTWNDFERFDGELHGRPFIVVQPQTVAAGRPWIWRARFFGHRPEADLALLQKGYHLIYCDVAGLFGAPKAVDHWDKCYATLTTTYQLHPKPVLEGMSRGGLIVFNWTAKNPDKVSCIYVDAPVCDIKSWPGGKKQGIGHAETWKQALAAYGFETEDEALAWRANPVDHAEKLANTKLPLFVVTGDADEVVPKEENIDPLIAAWKQAGGPLEVVVKPGVGHKHGLDDPAPLIEFLFKYSTPQ